MRNTNVVFIQKSVETAPIQRFQLGKTKSIQRLPSQLVVAWNLKNNRGHWAGHKSVSVVEAASRWTPSSGHNRWKMKRDLIPVLLKYRSTRGGTVSAGKSTPSMASRNAGNGFLLSVSFVTGTRSGAQCSSHELLSRTARTDGCCEDTEFDNAEATCRLWQEK